MTGVFLWSLFIYSKSVIEKCYKKERVVSEQQSDIKPHRFSKLFSYKNAKSLVINLVVFAIFFNALHWFQSSHLLDEDLKAPLVQLNLPTLTGEQFDHTALTGKKTVVYFFAPWCQVCHLSIGNLENLYQSQGDEVNVLAVALSFNSKNEVDVFVADKQLTFDVLLGTDEVMSAFHIRGFPTYYVFDEQGNITGRTQGYSTELGLRLRALL